MSREKFQFNPNREEAPPKEKTKPFDETKRNLLKKIAVAAVALAFNDINLGTLADPDDSIKPGREKTAENAETVKARETVKEILRTFNTSAISSRIDSDVLSSDFLMALQFQESRFDPKAVSSKGAQGVFQDLPQATQDVVEYLSFLRKKGKDTYTKKACDYHGPDSISYEQAEVIGSLFKEKSDYGRAVGKLYLLALHDKESNFNHFPNSDVFRNLDPQGRPVSEKPKPVEEQQDLLALSYHDGPKRRFDPKHATENGINYLKYVHRHLAIIKDLRKRLIWAGMSARNDYAIIKIMKRLDRAKDKAAQEAAILRDLKLLQAAHISKGVIHKDLVLSSNEIDRIFEKA